MQHSSIVGGSTAKRVINCPGSVALVAKMPPKPSSKFADEGTLLHNVIAEIIGTFVLVLALLTVLSPANLVPGSDVAKGFGPMLVGLIVWSIGLSLGGTTGYAINPARDLGPRIAHAILPIAGKGGSDWSYAWVPVVGPVIGGLLGAVTYKALWGA